MNHNRRQTLKAAAVVGVFGLCLLTQSLWPLLAGWLLLLIPTARKQRHQPSPEVRRAQRIQRRLEAQLKSYGTGYGHSNDNGG